MFGQVHPQHDADRLATMPIGGLGGVHEVAHRERHEMQPGLLPIEPSQIEQVADHPFQTCRFGLHHRAHLCHRVGRHDVVGEGLGVASQRGEGGAQVVRHRQQELPLSGLRVGQRASQAVDRRGDRGDLGRTGM